MARQRTTKSIASRIELDYYRRTHPLRAWRARCAAAGFVVPLLVLASFVAGGDEEPASPGPLTAAHALATGRCEECHARWSGVEDANCAACHPRGRHHESQVFDPACASCHSEHGGAQTLARPADVHCTQCHADLTVRGRRQSLDFARHVDSFARHPEFAFRRERRADPGTVKLDHRKHLELSMPTLGRTMACADCHRPDETGRRMRPIEYERDCRSCHELSLEGELAGRRATHGSTMSRLRDELRGFATERVLDPLAARDGSAAPPLLPDGRTREQAIADGSVTRWIERAVADAFDFVTRVRCAECHELARDADGTPSGVAAPAIPARWMAHAEFDHEAHAPAGAPVSDGACAGCHAGVQASTRSADVLLPGIESCRECHGVTARADCVLCHGYHPPRAAASRATRAR